MRTLPPYHIDALSGEVAGGGPGVRYGGGNGAAAVIEVCCVNVGVLVYAQRQHIGPCCGRWHHRIFVLVCVCAEVLRIAAYSR